MIDIRARSVIPEAELQAKKGKVLTPSDYNVLLTGPTRVAKPDGTPLAIYLPGAVKEAGDACYDVLTTIRSKTDNRGLASGSARVKAGTTRTRSMPIMSSIAGAMDPVGPMQFCRLTAWTGHETQKWESLRPLWQAIAGHFKEMVPDRYAKQLEYAEHTHPHWIIPETPFTTVTINNSYSTGVHTDSGDLDKGFSCLAAVRRGGFTGGHLTFPEYRVAVNMQDGDLLLMDAHEYHGNTQMVCACGNPMIAAPCKECGAERISVVCYYRTQMFKCDKPEVENDKRLAYAEKRAQGGDSKEQQEQDEMELDAKAVVT